MSLSVGPEADLAPRVVGGRWEIFEVLAQGGMGTVYRGRHRVTGQAAAVKVLEQGDDLSDLRKRFEREVQLAAAINHPGIVQVFDAGDDGATGMPYLAMELLSGRTLSEVMDAQDAQVMTLLRYLRALLEPLAVAHAAGIVHRDLKPDNVFVLSDPKNPVKLLDFGIARNQASPRLTQTGSAVGTPGYMSPEQALGKEVTPATDSWAIGVMLYEILTGEHPFESETAHGVIVAACTKPHVPLMERVNDVHPLLAELVDRCLEKDSSRRPPDAGTLILDLSQVLGLVSVPPSRRPSRRSDRPNAPVPRADVGATVNLAVEAAQEAKGLSGVRPVLPSQDNPRARLLRQALVPGLAGSAAVVAFVASIVLWGPAAALTISLLAAMGAAGWWLRQRWLAHLGQTTSRARSAARPSSVPAPEAAPSPPALGPEHAPVSMVLFLDLACPDSRRAKVTLDRLRELHPNTLRVVFRHAPLREASYPAAEAALEAFSQGGESAFWRFVELLLRGSRRVTRDHIVFLYEQLEFSVPALRHAWRSQRHWLTVDDDRELAQTLGVRAPPAFVLQGRLFDVDTPAAVLSDAVEAALRPSLVANDVGTQIADVAVYEERDFEQILVQWTALEGAKLNVVRSRADAQDRAERLLARAKGERTDFEKLARTFSDSSARVVNFTELPEELWHDVASLESGELSNLLESSQGFHILRRH